VGFINYRVLLRDPNGYVQNGFGYDVTEGDLEGNGINPPKDKPVTDLMIPVGIGANYKLNSEINIEIEASSRFINSDRLDARVKGENDKYWFFSVGVTYMFSNKEFLADILNR
jgi:OOP family OmpA-OmpF porin